MAELTPTLMRGPGYKTMAKNILTASDTFIYQAGDILILSNETAGALTVTLDGSDSSSWPVDGSINLTTTAGIGSQSIAAGAARIVPLDTIRAWLQGEVTVTGGAGMTAYLLRL